MRVISGCAKGIPLSAVKSCKTRPVLDRVKESLFNILADSIIGVNVIDLFAGTGGLGIEALSRGALSCLFVDKSYEATHIIKKNLEKTSLCEKSKIIRSDVFAIYNNQQFIKYRNKKNTGFGTDCVMRNDNELSFRESNYKNKCLDKYIDAHQDIGFSSNSKGDLRQFDIILVGAPYPVVEQEHTRNALFELFKKFVENQILYKGIIVLQHKKERLKIPKNLYSVEIYDSRVYGKTQITFLRPYIEV